MTEFEIMRKVELPMAVPSIMTGVRGASINIIATATIAPLVGVVTLGDFILGENVYGVDGVVAGAMVTAILALLFEFGLAGLQRRLTSKGLRLQTQ
jgi:osmoprotectant transport system permease protein